jgi:hypothetical protein
MIVARRKKAGAFLECVLRPTITARFDCTRAARVIYVLDREIKLLFMPLWKRNLCRLP